MRMEDANAMTNKETKADSKSKANSRARKQHVPTNAIDEPLTRVQQGGQDESDQTAEDNPAEQRELLTRDGAIAKGDDTPENKGVALPEVIEHRTNVGGLRHPTSTTPQSEIGGESMAHMNTHGDSDAGEVIKKDNDTKTEQVHKNLMKRQQRREKNGQQRGHEGRPSTQVTKHHYDTLG